MLDGLSPAAHLQAARILKHPFVGDVVSTPVVRLALAGQGWPAEKLVQWRLEVSAALDELATAAAP